MGRERVARLIAVDTSALVAIVLGEAERDPFIERIEASTLALVSTVSAVEARIVVRTRRGEKAVFALDEILGWAVFELVAPDSRQADAAYAAFVLYGKGQGHPAALNMGDLFGYALAKVRGVPLLFKGDDFARTDIDRA